MSFAGDNRFRTLAAVLALAVGALPLPASAHDAGPPFLIRFPQETLKTKFHNDFGSDRDGRSHRGNDLMAEHKMAEVYAIADGTVVKINERSRPGRYVIIEHEDGWDSLYIHLNDDNPGTDDGEAPWSLTLAPGVEVGEPVRAGQLIGWGGDSGNAERGHPHTHFELHHKGVEVNPYRYLVEAFERDHAEYLRKQELFENQVSGVAPID